MKKLTFQRLATSLMRQAATSALMLFALSANADDGDRWMAYALITPTVDYYCNFEVVSEANATVKIISREDEGYPNTLGSVSDVQSFWIQNEVIHGGKNYRIVGIGERAFNELTALQEVVYLGDYIEFIDDEAFNGCSNLLSIHLPEGLKSIGTKAFYGCNKLYCTNNNGHYDSGLVLPSTLETIRMQAFQNCLSLTSITFPDGLKYIDRWSFAYCTGLTSVELPNSMEDISGGAFAHSDNLKSINLRNVVNNAMLTASSGVVYRKHDDGSYELACVPTGLTGSYTIADFTSSLGDYCFDSCRFSEIHIPFTVSYIGMGAFMNNTSLADVYVEWVSENELPQHPPTDPFFTSALYDKPYRTLHIPDAGIGANAEQIAQTYTYSEWPDWFDNMSTYIVPNVEGLWIAGWGVKRTMATNINVPELSTGKISYDIYTKTLTLKDVTLDCEYNDIGIRNDGISYLTIKLSGNNAINVNAQGINTNKITYIVGPGSLTISSYYDDAIHMDYWDLFINDCTLDLDSRGGAITGDGSAYVYVNNSNIIMRPTSVSGVATINGIKKFDLTDCFISNPVFGTFDSDQKTIIDYQNEPCYGYVIVKPGKFYDFYVEDIPVTNLNCNNIVPDGLNGGSISYDPDNNVLTLDNVQFFSNNSFLLNNNDYLYLELVGNNYINTTEDCFWLLDDMYFQGSGKLETDADMGVAIKILRPWVWAYFWETNAYLKGVGGAIYGENDCEQQGVQIVNSHVKLASNGNYKVTDCLNTFDLENCAFVHDYFYFDEDQGCICDERFYGDPVYQDVIEIKTTFPTSITQPDVLSDATSQHQDQSLYDLQGRRLNGKPQKGVFIQNGKRVVIK